GVSRRRRRDSGGVRGAAVVARPTRWRRGRLPDGFDAARRGAVGASDTALVLHLGPRARRRVPVARPTAADRGRSVRVPGVGVLPTGEQAVYDWWYVAG